MRHQGVGQRLQPVFTRDLRLRPALRLVRQVNVFEPRLGVGLVDLRFQLGVELALFAHAVEDRLATVPQLAQVAQPLLQRTQLRIVQRAGRLLAVAGDERDCSPAVQQFHGCRDLPFGDGQFLGDTLADRFHGHDSI